MLKGLIFLLVSGLVAVGLALFGMALVVALIGAGWRAMAAPFRRRG